MMEGYYTYWGRLCVNDKGTHKDHVSMTKEHTKGLCMSMDPGYVRNMYLGNSGTALNHGVPMTAYSATDTPLLVLRCELTGC